MFDPQRFQLRITRLYVYWLIFFKVNGQEAHTIYQTRNPAAPSLTFVYKYFLVEISSFSIRFILEKTINHVPRIIITRFFFYLIKEANLSKLCAGKAKLTRLFRQSTELIQQII